MDPLRFAIALMPLALYAIVMGLLRLRAQPTVLSAALDMLLLGMAAMGMVAIGPLELFFPRAAFALLGNWVWALLIGLYLFGILLCAISLSPRLIVYGIDADELRSQLQRLLLDHSIEADWLEDIVILPKLGIRASVESAGPFRISQLCSAGRLQNVAGWYALEKLLVTELKGSHRSSAPFGVLFLCIGLLLGSAAATLLFVDRVKLHQIVSSLFEREDS